MEEKQITNNRYNLIILLLFIILGTSALLYLRIDKLGMNISNITDLGSLSDEINNNFSDIKNKIEQQSRNQKIIVSADSSSEKQIEKVTNNEPLKVKYHDYHKIASLIGSLLYIKDNIYNGEDYNIYLRDFDEFDDDPSVKYYVEALSKYLSKNIAIIDLITELDKVNNRENNDESDNLESSNELKTYFFNLIKIKKLNHDSIDEEKIAEIKNLLIKRKLNQLKETINNLNIQNKLFDKWKMDFFALNEIIIMVEELHKHIISQNFVNTQMAKN